MQLFCLDRPNQATWIRATEVDSEWGRRTTSCNAGHKDSEAAYRWLLEWQSTHNIGGNSEIMSNGTVSPVGKTVFLAKDDWWCRNAAELARLAFGEGITTHHGSAADAIPQIPDGNHFALISFRSPWIVPSRILEQFDFCINFHPATRDYPGYGCYSFAIYDEVKEYGCVCHHMEPRVDTGPLIAECRFKLVGTETVELLKLRTYTVMLSLFQDVIFALSRCEQLPLSGTGWSRHPFTRRDHDALRRITPDMDSIEVSRRIRATSYPGEEAYVYVGGVQFSAPTLDRPPLA